MRLTKFIGGFLILFLSFGRGYSGDTWPGYVKCPGGNSTNENHQDTFDWALKDSISFESLFLSKTLESVPRNFSRMKNCGGDTPIQKNLCNPKKDTDFCALSRTSICVRTATLKLNSFSDGDYPTKFAMHNYHCDGKGNYLYYGVALRERKNTAKKFPLNLEPELNIVSTESGVKLMTFRFYFFHDLPDLLNGYHFAFGFVYIQVQPTDAITNIINIIGARGVNP